METTSSIKDAIVEKQDGKHLVFLLGGSSYGIPILEVSDINGLLEITSIPKTPDFIKGVINLRGKVIPVMDLRLKFGMPEKEYDKLTCIIIVNLSINNKAKQMGVIVDTVSEVFDIPLSEIEDPPSYGSDVDDDFLNGIGKVKGKLVVLLNIAKVLHSDDVIELLTENEGL
jgi:purine-binding chemotaxis protein CheW